MEIEEFTSRLENYLRYGNVRGPKRSIPITLVPFCPLKATLIVRYDMRFSGEKDSGKILGTILHAGLLNTIRDAWDYLRGDIEEEPRIEVPVQHELGNGWVLTGRADLVIGKHVFEFKFMDDGPYEHVPETIEEVDDNSVLKAYIEQLNAYLNLIPGAEMGHLWIFRRNEIVPWKKLDVTKSREDFEKFLERARKIVELINQLERGEIPHDFEPRFQWECENRNYFCTYKPLCPKFR